MAISLTSPVTGGAQTGFTSPTYTVITDVAPDVNAKQWAVSALGGTQTGATTHSGSSPFTVSFSKPKRYTVAGPVNANGVGSSYPVNRYTVIVRKGARVSDLNPKVVFLRCSFEVPTTTETTDGAELRAAMSLLLGALWQQSANLGDLVVLNTL